MIPATRDTTADVGSLEARPIRRSPPWHFRLAKAINRWCGRGGFHLIEWAERTGRLACDVRYDLSPGGTLDVPLDRRPNQWAMADLLQYESELVEKLGAVAHALPRPVRWIDVGADIGTLTALVARQHPEFAEGWAFEPNPDSFVYLRKNTSTLPFPVHALAAAVGPFSGQGRLASSPSDKSPHAMFLEMSAEGTLPVVRLDDVLPVHDSETRSGSFMLKIDVEGGELGVLQGAERLLRETPHWCVAFEAHADVARRTGIDPAACVRWLRSLRELDAFVAEMPERVIDGTTDFFDASAPSPRICNIVCVSRRRGDY